MVSRPRKVRFSLRGESSEMPFSEGVRESLQAAANSAGVDLLVLDNHYDAQTAVRNAKEFVRQQVDLVIEFQIDQRIAPAIADKISGAGIPLVAVDIPHPHATYFGVDNYRVGFEAGQYLAHFAKTHWGGEVNRVLGLGIEEAGPLLQSRITVAVAGLIVRLPWFKAHTCLLVDGAGPREKRSRLH